MNNAADAPLHPEAWDIQNYGESFVGFLKYQSTKWVVFPWNYLLTNFFKCIIISPQSNIRIHTYVLIYAPKKILQNVVEFSIELR